ncbi:hypothetical protein Syun_022110 [Stephania yunnanensis]|uniref:Bet v I/Major latex protein domain-containing protein n=1 Tax=Stephania yunnanensis TaxID=152371 RepID=A0AAP0NQ99_9MAGN
MSLGSGDWRLAGAGAAWSTSGTVGQACVRVAVAVGIARCKAAQQAIKGGSRSPPRAGVGGERRGWGTRVCAGAGGGTMAQLSRQLVLEVENEIKCPADAFYEFMKNKFIDAHLLFPEIYKNSKVLQGDGKSLGSVIQWSYVIDAKSDQYLEVKAKLSEVDDEKR